MRGAYVHGYIHCMPYGKALWPVVSLKVMPRLPGMMSGSCSLTVPLVWMLLPLHGG